MSSSAATPITPRNLVRWEEDGVPWFGAVVDIDGGRRIRVRFDSGEERLFVWPSEVVERVRFDKGQHVRVLASDLVGVVVGSREHNGVGLYQVSLPNGTTPMVMEDGIRPAVLTDPIERLRAGELHGARSTNLRVAATRLLFAYQHDELSTLGNSRVEIKPHQVGAVHRVANTYPHRFILADEVGLGKTIEAGLLVRELAARGVAKRILVLVPSGLVGQWQQELKTKFNLTFSIYNSESIAWLRSEHPTDNVWTVRDAVIASTSYASWSPERHREIASAGWDMVIIDEAHHARRSYRGEGKYQSTNLHRLAEQLADPDLASAQAMLLLTATPMQLHRFELYSLIELLDPALFPSYKDFEDHTNELRGLNETVERVRRWSSLSRDERNETLVEVETWLGENGESLGELLESSRERIIGELQGQHRLSQVMVRNRKRVVGGFMPRVAAIWEVDLTDREWEAYWATTRYVQTGYARSKANQNNALGFLMATFQKLNASSSHALKRSLERRIEKLEKVTEDEHRKDILDEAVLEESPTAEALDQLLGQRVDADWEEIRELENLVELLEGIEVDSKMQVLVENLAKIAVDDPHAKVIIFTQFRATQDYIRDHIGHPWTVNLFHGQLKPQEKDAGVGRFRDGHGPQVLISTEAGGEGRNFQYCHVMVNYDLPWNPMKVEQRIGRIDRIGQKRPVTIFNFSTKGTIEERVVEVLTGRIGVFRDTIGGLDPILGAVESDLRKIFSLAKEEADRQLAVYEGRLDARMHEARQAEQRLADLIMDTRSYRKDEVERLLDRPRAVNPLDIQRLVLGALSEMKVDIDRDRDHAGVYILRFNDSFERLFPDEYRAGRTRKVTFDLSVALEREEVDFLAFGHPIVDGLVAHVRAADYGGITSHRIVLTDEVPPCRGWFFLYVLELKGFSAVRELHPVFVDSDGRLDPDLARWLLDRAMTGRREEFAGTPTLPAHAVGLEAAIATADSEAIVQLMDRQQALETLNLERLESERRKRERFYDYRAQAAADKLAADQRVYARLLGSPEDDDRRILPVWGKRVEQATRMIEAVEQERATRLSELDGCDRVHGQHEVFSASFVEIEPDPKPLLDEVRSSLTPSMFEKFLRLSRPRVSAEDVAGLGAAVAKRRAQLVALSKQHAFDIGLATAVADAYLAALEDLTRFASKELPLLYGAIQYFLELDDEAHDLKSPAGFLDDAQVANIVLESIGRPELRVAVA